MKHGRDDENSAGVYRMNFSHEIKHNDELLYLMERNNITDIDLVPCGSKSLMRS